MRVRTASLTAALAAPLALALGTVPAAAQDAPAAPAAAVPAAEEAAQPAPAPVPTEYVYVALTTSAGVITLGLDKTHAPLTTANFLKYVDSKRMDGAVFYRAMHLGYSDTPAGLLQGGVRDGAKLLPPVAHETTNQTGILHKAGTVSMARFAPGSATADFMILISDMAALDAEKGNAGTDPGAGFAAFGHVVGGMDVVDAIWNMPRSATKGEGVMKGDILENEVRITSARRVAEPPQPESPAVEAETP
jgi:peptidyl-prolyl cis-trans isomerase A (cyclophilin A)